MPAEADDDDGGEMDVAAEEARVVQEEHAKLEAQKQAMLLDQVAALLPVRAVDWRGRPCCRRTRTGCWPRWTPKCRC